MKKKAIALSVTGRSHNHNEDYSLCNNEVMVVADGMGGEKAGEIASKLASDIIFEELSCLTTDNPKEVIREAIMHADKAICEYVDGHPECNGMGTTVLVALIQGNKVNLGWVGDSRAYLFNSNNGLKPLTKDHSYVQELIDDNKISVEESFTHPDNNLITRYVGGGCEDDQIDVIELELSKDDVLLLCSDGVCGYCHDEEIKERLQQTKFNDIPQTLIDLAIAKGSDDDITVAALVPVRNLFSRCFG